MKQKLDDAIEELQEAISTGHAMQFLLSRAEQDVQASYPQTFAEFTKFKNKAKPQLLDLLPTKLPAIPEQWS